MNDTKQESGRRTQSRWRRFTAAAVLCALALSVVLTGCSQEAPAETAPSVEPRSVETPAPEASEEATVAPATTAPNAQVMLPEMAELYAENNEIIGWIEIKGTEVDYPVMYTPDDGQFYLYRTFEKEEDPTKEGCLFVDEFCKVDPRDTNLLIHGHNMKNGTMFHSLLNYQDEEYYQEHPVITFNTLYDEEQYEIAYVFRSQVYNQDDDVFKFYKFYNAANEEEYKYYTDNCKELELYSTGVTPEYDDDLITLNTCEYTVENGRMVVVARKITEDRPAQSEYARAWLESGQGTAAEQDAEEAEAAEADAAATALTGDISA
ncbi:MAG: class B sortase [Clostridia bacterium]|nr:class B sortase [Clostridia bacterium]